MNPLKKPLFTVLVIFLLCFLFRAIEYFLLRTDQTFWGEAFLHKLIGIAILYLTVKLLSSNLEYIGFLKKEIWKHIFMGLLFGIFLFFIAYGIEICITISQGSFQSLQLYVSSYAVIQNVGYQTGILFFAICIIGNIINVWMEEGVFRGLFQKILQQKYTFLRSAVIASVFFGIWHIMGPIRNYADGISSTQGMIANIAMLVTTSGLGGFQYALMTKLTGSLYMAMGAHFVNNTIVNLLHVITSAGADEWMIVRITIAQSLSFVLVLFYYLYTRRKHS